jgi:hypothetical protein
MFTEARPSNDLTGSNSAVSDNHPAANILTKRAAGSFYHRHDFFDNDFTSLMKKA